MADAARSMAGAQNPVGNKVRDALGEAQQNELEMHMRQNAQWIRQGYGSSAWVRENSVTMGLNNLRDQLQQAQAASQQQGGKPGQGPGGDKGDLEKALARMEAMRSRMQQLAQSQQGKGKPAWPRPAIQSTAARQPEWQWPAARSTARPEWTTGPERAAGTKRSARAARSAGPTRSEQGQSGQSGNGSQAGNGTQNGSKSWLCALRRRRPGDARQRLRRDAPLPMEQAYRESLRDLNQLRDFVRQNPDVAGDYSNLSRALNPAYASNDAELSNRLSHEVLPEMERLELEIRRKLEEKNSDQVRARARKPCRLDIPNAVADYFRKLSKGNK